jgi:exodeoxyribonuclease V alpha subunit
MDLFDRIRRGGADGGVPEETLEGTVERIVFSGGGGEFTVARLRVDGQAEPLTVVGSLLGIPVGAKLKVTGRREVSPRFGPQFRVSGYTEVAPATLEGIRRYLGSGLIKGIGPEFASRIVG